MKILCKSLFAFFLVFILFSCDTWMKSDDFFDEIDQEVFVANAEKVNVYVRYAVTTQGTTAPSGSSVFKVDVLGDISCVTNTSYGFHHWAAFSNKFFDIQGQNKNIIYESGEGAYNDTILPYELGEDVVSFGDKFSQSTTIKIHAARNDIVLVPIVALRPTIDRLSPSPNQAGVVRNTSLRYLFSKKMDLSTFNSDNINIKSGYSVMTDQEIVQDEITDKFIWTNLETGTYSPVRSVTGKMVTFRLRPGDTLGSNRQITIDLLNSIKDEDGYEMETDQRIYFTTGTSVDSLAPIIQELKCGIGDKFATFDSIQFNGDAIRNNGSIRAITDTVFDSQVEHRVKNGINIYLYATDIGGEGINASVSNVDEDAVSFYGIRAKVLYDSNGASSDKEIEAAQYAYVPNGNDISVKTSDEMNNRGYAFSYDLSSLPDGLIEIDVWAMDTVGNNGLDEPYYATYDNGYRTLLVVKDTSAPNANEEKSKVISKSNDAIYGWYNAETLGSTFVMVGKGQSINDSGHARLQAREDKIKWIFTVGDDPKKWTPSAMDAGWRTVTNGAYDLGGINVQKEGAIGILMALMDDSENMSETVLLNNTVLCDLTKPNVSTPAWVDSNGNPARTISNEKELKQYLKVPFTENLSGVREISIDVGSASGIQSGTTKFYYNSISADSEISYSISTRNGKACAVLEPPADTVGYSSGTLFISGINIGDFSADETKTVDVVLYDAALNGSQTVSASMTYDKTAPVVQGVSVNEVVSDGTRKWLAKNAFTNVVPNNASVTVTAVETTGGIESVVLSGAKLTSNSKLYAGGREIPCSINEATGTITLVYSENPSLKNTGTITFSISGIEFTENIDNGSPNSVIVQLTDFAGNTQTNTIGDSIYIDSKPPAAPSVKIYDSSTAFAAGNEYWTWSDTRKSYTDTNRVYIEMTLTGNAATESGITSLTFNNVQFDSSTTVSPSGSASGSTIVFDNILGVNTTITVSGAKLLEENKTVEIGVSSTNLVGWTSGSGKDSILHDSTKPAFRSAPSWLSVSGADNNGITDSFNQINANKKQKLRIPYSEAGSGIKLITIDGATTDGVTSVSNGDTQLVKGTDYNLGKRGGKDYILFTTPLVSNSGTIYIEGLSITDTHNSGDARVDVTISMYDAAENNDASASGNKATICIDETAPIITKAVLPDVKRILHYGDLMNTYLYFIGKKNLQSAKTDVILYIKEATSGIKTISFGGSIKPTDSSTITINNTAVSGFTVNNGVITFANAFTICDTTKNEFELKITNCQIEKIKTAPGATDINTISVTATDFAGLSTANALTKATFGVNEEYSEIRANKLPAATPSVTLKDRGTSDYALELESQDGYTNYEIVDGTIALVKTDSVNTAQKITLSGAKFVAETEIYIGTGATASLLVKDTDYTINENAVIFTKAFADAETTLTIKNIKISDATNGTKTIKVKALAPTEVESTDGTKTIILDKTAPKLNINGPATKSTAARDYPRSISSTSYAYGITTDNFADSSSIANNADNNAIRYFYTANDARDFVIEIQDDNDYKLKLIDNMDSSAVTSSAILSGITGFAEIAGEGVQEASAATREITLSNKAADSTKTYSYIAVDKAGNVSDAHTFYVIKDAEVPSTDIGGGTFTDRMVYTEPSGAYTHRNPASLSEIGYIIRKNRAADDKYKVTVKLKSIESSDVLISGSEATSSATPYSELTPTALQSGLASWTVTANNANPTSANVWTSPNISGEIEVFVNDYFGDGKFTNDSYLTLCIKDNCDNISKIDIQEKSGNKVKWTIDGEAPKAILSVSSTRTALDAGTLAAGNQFGRAYVNGNVTYFNDNAYLGVKITNAEAVEFSDDGISIDNTANHDYTLKMQLYFSDTEINESTLSSASKVGDWYKIKNSSAEKHDTIYMEYPKPDSEGGTGYYYVVLEDTVGNRNFIQVTNEAADKFCYNNEPSKITQSALASLITPKVYTKFVEEGDVITVYGGGGSFNVNISQTAQSGFKYKYSTSPSETITSDAGFTAGNSYTSIPLSDDLIPEKESGAVANKLYLYALDNVGNYAVLQIGNANTTWFKDTKAPTVNSWKQEGHANPGNSYISRNETSGNLTIAIAASKLNATYNKTSPYSVYIPTSWFTDAGIGVCGISLEKNDIENVSQKTTVKTTTTNDVECYELTIPENIHTDAKYKTTELPYYVYDKVGNFEEYKFTVYADANGPKLGVKLSVSSENRLHAPDLKTSFEETSTDKASNSFTASNGYKNNNLYAYTEKTEKEQDENNTVIIWTTTSSVNIELEAYDTNGISSISIDRKNSSGGYNTFITPFSNTESKYKNWIFDKTKTDTTTEDTKYNHNNCSNGVITLDATEEGAVYRISAANFNGNPMMHYIKLILDNKKPDVSPSVNMNSGATKDNDTYYYNSMNVNFGLTHSTTDISGLGDIAHKFYTDSETETSVDYINNAISSETVIDFNNEKYSGSQINLSVQDFLGNENKYTLNHNGINKFTYDNKVPTWNTKKLSRLSLKYHIDSREGYGTSTEWKTYTSGTRVVVDDETGTENLFIDVNTEFDANVEITPSASDNKKLRGFIASTSGAKPSVDSSTVICPVDKPFILSCSKNHSETKFVSTAEKSIPTATSAVGESDSNFMLRTVRTGSETESAQSLAVYFHPVDCAGNVGTAQKVTIRYNEHKPIVVKDSSTNKYITVAPDTNHLIYQAEGVNYFRGVSANSGSPDDATGEDSTGVKITAKISLKNSSVYPLTGFKIVGVTSGNEYAHHSYKEGEGYSSSAYKSSSETQFDMSFNLPYSFATQNANEELYIVFYNQTGDSIPQLLTYKGVSKWAEDITGPSAPTEVKQVTSESDGTVLNNGDNGFYLAKNGSDNILYYKDGKTKDDIAYLYFTASDPNGGTSAPSGYKGVGTSYDINATETGDTTEIIGKTYPVKVINASGDAIGSQTFYAYDNVLNRENTGMSITYTEDGVPPNISSVGLAGQAGSGFYRPANSNDFYFNAKAGHEKQATAITLTVNANDALSGIKSYNCATTNGTTTIEQDNTNKNVFTITNLDYTNTAAITITVMDYVGNEATETITLIPDSTGPKITVDAFKSGSNPIADLSEYIYVENNDWKTVSGGTVWFNRNELTPAITFKASDVGGSSDGQAIIVSGDTTISMSTDGSKVVTATATDNVGNTSTFTVTFKADGTAPAIEVEKFKNGTNNIDNDSPHIHVFNSNWRTVSGSEIWFNSEFLSPAVTFSATDTGGSSETQTITVTADKDISTSSDTTVTATAKDRVGNQATFKLTFKPDKGKPSISTPSLSGETSVYLNASKDKVYYKGDNDSRKGTLKFTASDTTGESGLGGDVVNGFFYSSEKNLQRLESRPTLYSEYTFKAAKESGDEDNVIALAEGSHYFYTADWVGNISDYYDSDDTSAGYKLEFVNDTDAPNVGITSVVGDKENCYKYEEGSKTLYFNSGSVDSKKIDTITITLTASDAKSGLKDTPVTSTLGTVTESGGTYTVTITGGDIPSSQTNVTITATDNVGNADTTVITLVPDGTKPTITPTFTNAGTAIDEKYKSGSLAHNGTMYFNANKVTSPKIEFSASDSVSNIADGGITYKLNGAPIADLTVTPLTISTNDGVTTTVTAIVKDKVGHETECEIKFIADKEKPTITSPALAENPSGFYLKPGTDKIYYNNVDSRAASLSFTVADTNSGLNTTGEFFDSDEPNLTELPAGQTFKTSFALDKDVTGTKYFYTADKVANVSEVASGAAGYKIEFISDIAAPIIEGIAISTTGGSAGDGYYDNESATDRKIYFNDKVSGIKFTVTVADKMYIDGIPTELSGVASYSYKLTGAADATVKTGSNANIFEITDLSDIHGKTLTITITDNVGNKIETIITFTVDNTIPTTALDITATDDDNSTVYTSGDGYYLDGDTFYFKDAVTSVTFTPSSTDEDVIYNFNFTGASTSTDTTATVTPSDGGTLKIIAKDKVGNSIDKTITFIVDNTSPTISAGGASLDYSPNGIFYDSTAEKYFYNADSSNSNYVSSITINVDDTKISDGTTTPKFVYTFSTDADDSSATKNPVTGTSFDITPSGTDTEYIKVYVVDSVGNYSTTAISFTIVPDGAAPVITGETGTTDKTYYLENSDTWYVLNSVVDGNLAETIALHNGTINLPLTETGSGIAKYLFINESSAGDEPDDSSMSDYDGSAISLPDTVSTSSLYLWLKDNVGNAKPTNIVYKVSDSKTLPIGKYAAATDFTYTLSSSDKKLTISDYPVSAGLKSITIDGITVSNQASCSDILNWYSPVNAGTATLVPRDSKIFFVNNDINITFDNEETSITSISITDAAGYTITKTGDSYSWTDPSGNSYTPPAASGSDPTTNIISHSATTDTTPSIISTVSHFVSRVVNFIPDDSTDEITVPRARKPRKTSAKSDKKSSSKKSSSAALDKNTSDVSATPVVTDVSEILDTTAQDVPESTVKTIVSEIADNAQITDIIADVIDHALEDIVDIPEIVDAADNITIENNSDKVLAENKIYDYNYSNELYVDSSKTIAALIAVGLAVLACIIFGVVSLLKRKRINKRG